MKSRTTSKLLAKLKRVGSSRAAKTVAKAGIAAAVPAAYGYQQAPDGSKKKAVKESLKWSAIGALPGAALGGRKGLLASAMAAGFHGAERSARESRAKVRSYRTNKLIGAMSKKMLKPGQLRYIKSQEAKIK